MDTKPNIVVFQDSNLLTTHLVDYWLKTAEQYLRQRNRFTVALSGGRTPIEFYHKLSAANFKDWDKTHIFLVDERFVPVTHPDSNLRILKENLCMYVDIPPENIHPIETNLTNAAFSAEHYKQTLVHFFDFKKNNLPSFDLITLGIGDDGHTASLFPGEENIDDPRRLTVPTSRAEVKHDRISLSLSVINNAEHILFMIVGKQKAEIVHKILDEQQPDLPAARVKPTAGELNFLLDYQAASKCNLCRNPDIQKIQNIDHRQ